MKKMTLALCQTAVGLSKEENLDQAAAFVRRAAGDGAALVCLPEMFNCPYENSWFVRFAENQDGPSFERLARMARENGVYLIGGSVPEREAGDKEKIYNTSYCFDPAGQLLAKHRKAFLFDIDVKEAGFSFKESDTLKAGEGMSLFDSPWGKIGVAICFDIRFPELFRAMAGAGAVLIAVPGAFSMATGPDHWSLSLRMRAVDNQVFTAGIAPARDEGGVYVSYAHSLAADPWGRVLNELGTEPGVLLQEIDFSVLEKTRTQLPLLSLYQKKKAEGFFEGLNAATVEPGSPR
jgi:predicted amidohydrolase